MVQQTPQSLLSLPQKVRSPEAYQVLGLKPFEADRAKIKAAAEATVLRLNQLKASADATAWATAMKWTKEAYTILSDVSKKAAYDRKLAADQAAKMPAVDPLAGVLPTAAVTEFTAGHSARPSLPSMPPTVTILSPQPQVPPPLAIPPQALPAASPAAAEVTLPRVSKSTPIRRRRGLPWTPILLTTFCVIAMAGLGGLVYVLQNGSPIIIYAAGGPAPGSLADGDGDGRAVAIPTNQAPREKRAYDPVMGSLAGEMPPPPPVQEVDDMDQPIGEPTNQANADTAMPAPAPSPGESTTVSMPMNDIPLPEPTAEQLQAADAAIEAAKASVVQHQWSSMTLLAEKAKTTAASPAQKELAESIFQLVDLATYYRGAIEKGLGTLQAGNDFDLQPELKVVIVEVSSEKLIIRFNGKNKEYTFNTLPLLLAHQFARIALPEESPTAQAAMNAFQAIAPVSTPQHREAAIAAIEQMGDEIEGAEPAKVVAAIRYVNQP